MNVCSSFSADSKHDLLINPTSCCVFAGGQPTPCDSCQLSIKPRVSRMFKIFLPCAHSLVVLPDSSFTGVSILQVENKRHTCMKSRSVSTLTSSSTPGGGRKKKKKLQTEALSSRLAAPKASQSDHKECLRGLFTNSASS